MTLQKLGEGVSLFKAKDDSMIGIGIDDKDLVLVQSSKEFSTGNIVLADVDGETTIKRFISDDKPPYLYLKPENPSYKIIYFNESIELKGKIIAVIKNGQLKQIK